MKNKNKNGENITRLEITGVVLILLYYCQQWLWTNIESFVYICT